MQRVWFRFFVLVTYGICTCIEIKYVYETLQLPLPIENTVLTMLDSSFHFRILDM